MLKFRFDQCITEGNMKEKKCYQFEIERKKTNNHDDNVLRFNTNTVFKSSFCVTSTFLTITIIGKSELQNIVVSENLKKHFHPIFSNTLKLQRKSCNVQIILGYRWTIKLRFVYELKKRWLKVFKFSCCSSYEIYRSIFSLKLRSRKR